MEEIRIVTCDDHAAYREGLCSLLSNEKDFEFVGTAPDGYEAVRLVAELKPDVFITDIDHPGLSGIATTRQVKKVSPDTAVLIVTATEQPSYILASLRAGAAGYLTKNAPLHELISAIRTVNSGKGIFDLISTREPQACFIADKKEKGPDLPELRPRELRVLTLAAKGVINKEIATQLGISEHAVKTRLINIFKKLHVNSRTEAVLQALKAGWLTMADFPCSPNLSSNEDKANCIEQIKSDHRLAKALSAILRGVDDGSDPIGNLTPWQHYALFDELEKFIKPNWSRFIKTEEDLIELVQLMTEGTLLGYELHRRHGNILG